MRILIAEDDQVLADGLLRALRSAGAVVDHVASGSEADALVAAEERLLFHPRFGKLIDHWHDVSFSGSKPCD